MSLLAWLPKASLCCNCTFKQPQNLFHCSIWQRRDRKQQRSLPSWHQPLTKVESPRIAFLSEPTRGRAPEAGASEIE